MRCLVTGGAGFVGSHLAEELLRRGESVHVVDDLSTGSLANISHLKANPRFGFSIESVTNAPRVAELIEASDKVFHLAAAVGVRLVVESPVRAIETNLRATEVVLELASRRNM